MIVQTASAAGVRPKKQKRGSNEEKKMKTGQQEAERSIPSRHVQKTKEETSFSITYR